MQTAPSLNRFPSIPAAKMKLVLVKNVRDFSILKSSKAVTKFRKKNIPLQAFLQKIAKNRRTSKTLKQRDRKYSFLTARAQIISSASIPYQFDLYHRNKRSSFPYLGKCKKNWNDPEKYWKPPNGWNCINSSWSETTDGFGWLEPHDFKVSDRQDSEDFRKKPVFWKWSRSALTIKLLKLPKSHSKTPKSLRNQTNSCNEPFLYHFCFFREVSEFYNFFPAHQIPR